MRVLANAFWLSVSRTAADLLGFVLFALDVAGESSAANTWLEEHLGLSHHLAVGGTQPVRGLVQLPEVREPGAQALGPKGVDAEHVRHEPNSLSRLREQTL